MGQWLNAGCCKACCARIVTCLICNFLLVRLPADCVHWSCQADDRPLWSASSTEEKVKLRINIPILCKHRKQQCRLGSAEPHSWDIPHTSSVVIYDRQRRARLAQGERHRLDKGWFTGWRVNSSCLQTSALDYSIILERSAPEGFRWEEALQLCFHQVKQSSRNLTML